MREARKRSEVSQNQEFEERIPNTSDLLREKSSARRQAYQTKQERDSAQELVRLSQITGHNMVTQPATTNHK